MEKFYHRTELVSYSVNAADLTESTDLTRQHEIGDGDDTPMSPTTTATRSTVFSSLGLGSNAAPSSVSSFEPSPYIISQIEALSYYAGLPSEPRLIYRTGKPWFPPRGPEAQPRKKELRPVFGHPIVDLWHNGLSDEVVKIMDTHKASRHLLASYKSGQLTRLIGLIHVH